MNGFKPRSSLVVVAAGLLMTALSAGAQSPPPQNSPWYPSLQAFEHYDSGRSHVFSSARFGGSFGSPNSANVNSVNLRSSREGAFPSGYNTSYLDAKNAFIQGGSYGDVEGSIG